MYRKVEALALIVLFTGLAVRYQPVQAPGFGVTCMNRHDASFQSVLIHAPGVNYTGHGDEIVAAWLWGYTVTVFFKVNPTIMMNADLSGDISNGSIFFATNINGAWYPHCYYYLDILNQSWYPWTVSMQFHPANLTGYENEHQLVTLSTGTHQGQYNVSWIGP